MVGVSKTFTNQKRSSTTSTSHSSTAPRSAIIGLNGSGKSTLMKIIAGLDKNFQGEVVFARLHGGIP